MANGDARPGGSRGKLGQMSYVHGTAPDAVLSRHLKRKHGKTTSWVEDRGSDLREAHQNEHGHGRADHGLDDDLAY
jgi:hypothetical protein